MYRLCYMERCAQVAYTNVRLFIFCEFSLVFFSVYLSEPLLVLMVLLLMLLLRHRNQTICAALD